MLNLDDMLAPTPGVIHRESEGALVVVLPEQGKFLVLNGTGEEVFRLVDGQRTLGEIAALMHGRHEDVSLDQIQADVLNFAAKLLERGAVQAILATDIRETPG